MALHNIEGLNSIDNIVQRVGAGTIGGEHIVPGSVAGKRIVNVVDNSDPNVVYGYYGTGSASFTSEQGAAFSRSGTTIWTNSTNGAIQLNFVGTSIGIIAPSNPYGDFSATVYIDGAVAYGRVPIYSPIYFTAATVLGSTPALTPTATSLTLRSVSNFASSGYVLIDDEVIAYSSITGSTLNISGRGQQGTQATAHYYSATVYQWSSTLSFFSTDGYATQQTVFYNPFLSNGPHKITMVCSGIGGNMYLDAFVIGSLIGAQSLAIQTGTATLTATTSANGHVDIGALQTNNTNVQIVGVIGYEQTTPAANIDNANTMSKLGLGYNTVGTTAQTWEPEFFLHNGPAGTSVTVRVTFAYIGE